MKKIMQYAPAKFQKFPVGKQIRIIASFIEAIDRSWTDQEERKRLLAELQNCLSFLEDSLCPEKLAIILTTQIDPGISHPEFMLLFRDFLQSFGKEPRDYDLIKPLQTAPVILNPVPLYTVLDNLRSAFNVGSIIRTSECFGIRKVFMCGYTPTPDNIKVRKTAMATEERVLWERRDDIITLLTQLKEKEKLQIVALETSSDAQPLQQSTIEQPAALIVGNEALGISDKVLELADLVVKIPLVGRKESFNVGVAYGIACFEILRKWHNLAT